MAKVSVIIPARNEKYLPQTVESVLSNARGECEVVAVLEAYQPDGWANLQAKYTNLHTIYHSEPKGMRAAINAGVASAVSRGAKYILKSDAHCMFAEGFDEALKADCDADWVVIPRRKRLAPETWAIQDVGKPDIDYHYLSYPDDPNDFGGPGLNGKVWYERIKARLDDPQYDLDDEMASQGSFYFMYADYFTYLELMDEEHYGKFWNESQEVLNKCWLSGGRGVVNKKTWIAHWHKGKSGRGYSLPESWLRQGAGFTKQWIWNDAAFSKQTKPFEWLIDHFWPVPTWPENWREVLYAERKPRAVGSGSRTGDSDSLLPSINSAVSDTGASSLKIDGALYGVGFDNPDQYLIVHDKVQSLVKGNSLDLMVGNSTLGVGNPFRGQKKTLRVFYSFDGGQIQHKDVDERDWLIIGQSERWVRGEVVNVAPAVVEGHKVTFDPPLEPEVADEIIRQAQQPMSPTALNDYLIRKFVIPSHRLRGPMPIELPHFHRDDLAQLFAELGFNRGAEIGVAEGKYSEVLLKANPDCELLLVDPWAAYDGNKQQKTSTKHQFAYDETCRRTKDYPNAKMLMGTSMDIARITGDYSLDFVYLDANHSYDYFMEDLINWGRKVRSGGIIAGDDVYRLDPKRWGAGPMEGIYHYTQAHKIEPWFLINAHKSVDFFFVKP